MAAIAGLVAAGIAAGGSAYAANQQKSAMEDANRGAGNVEMWTERRPRGKSGWHRKNAMREARRLWDQYQSGRGYFGQDAGPGIGGPRTNDSREIADQIRDRAEGGHVLYDPANAYVQDTLEGQTRNPFMTSAADAFSGLQDDPYMTAFLDSLMGPGGGRGGGGGSFSGGGGGGGHEYWTRPYIESILNEKYLAEGNPHADALIENMSDDVRRQMLEEEIPGVTSQFAGSGRLGSNAWQQALAKSGGRMSDSIADMVSQVRYQDYNDRMGDLMDALGMGTQIDMNAANNAARMAASGQSAAASRYGDRLGAITDVLGMRSNLGIAGAQGLGGLADLFSGDQQFALSMVPELSGLDLRDLGMAFDASMSLDELDLERQRARAAAADRRRAEMNPWANLSEYANIINRMSSGYGVTHESGVDRRAQSPNHNYPDPWAEALAGGFSTWAGLQGGGGGGDDRQAIVDEWWQRQQGPYGNG